MARSGITYKDVKKAALTLLERGVNPSIQRVREVLGTGSNSTIGRYLKQWQQEAAENPPAPVYPIPEPVTVALEQFWKLALENAEAAYLEQREHAEQAVNVAEQARNEALAELLNVQGEMAQLRQSMQDLQATHQDLQGQWLIEQERRRHAETAIATSEQRATVAIQTAEQMRAEAAARVSQLENTLEQLRADWKARLLEAEQRLADEQRRHEASEAHWLNIIEQNRAEYATGRQAHSAEKRAWQAHERMLTSQLENARKAHATLQLQTASAEERANLAEAELNKAQAALSESQAQHLEAVRTMEALRGELKLADNKRQALEEKLEKNRKRAAKASSNRQRSL